MPHVLQVAEATIGGVRRHLRDLLLGLADAGWQVSVACARRRDPGFAHDVDVFRARGLNVFDVPMVRRPAPWGDLAAVRRLGAVIRACRPDVIHAHSTKAGLIARLAARRGNLPVCYTPHGFAFGMQVPVPLAWVYREVERLAIPLTSRLIAVSRAEAAAALDLGYAPEQVCQIPNGIPPPAVPPVDDAARVFDVAFIGRFCRQKGSDLAVAALRRLAVCHPGLRLVAMGGGSRANARALATVPGVTVLPFGEAAAVERVLTRSRVLAMPSRWEGMPYLLLEAMAAGTAVVASGVGGVTEVVADGREALIIPADDVDALVVGLIRLLDDDGLRRQLTAAARTRVAAFSQRGMIEATLAAYAEALANPVHAPHAVKCFDNAPRSGHTDDVSIR